MAKIFITGSADGLGQLAAKELIKQGHRVVLHARNDEHKKQALQQVPGAENVLIADLASLHETKELASKANALGTFDAVIHNAGVYQVPRNSITVDGLPLLLAVNTLAPYILTCLMHRSQRLIYMSSGMHLSGDPNLDNISPGGHVTYSDTKLHDVILAMAIGRKWPDTYANAVNPGWVPTKMGGAGAPDNLQEGYQTQVWLAVSNEAAACVSGQYFHHKQPSRFQQAAQDIAVQEKFLGMCENVSGVKFEK